MPVAGLYANTRENRNELQNFGLNPIYPLTAPAGLGNFTRIFIAAHGDQSGRFIRTGPRPKERSNFDAIASRVEEFFGIGEDPQRATSSFDHNFLDFILNGANLPNDATINIMACYSGVPGGFAQELSRLRPQSRVFAANNSVNGNTYTVQNGGNWICYENGAVTETHGSVWNS